MNKKKIGSPGGQPVAVNKKPGFSNQGVNKNRDEARAGQATPRDNTVIFS
jgi:hypothetical protein